MSFLQFLKLHVVPHHPPGEPILAYSFKHRNRDIKLHEGSDGLTEKLPLRPFRGFAMLFRPSGWYLHTEGEKHGRTRAKKSGDWERKAERMGMKWSEPPVRRDQWFGPASKEKLGQLGSAEAKSDHPVGTGSRVPGDPVGQIFRPFRWGFGWQRLRPFISKRCSSASARSHAAKHGMAGRESGTG